jgi:hypothetical protein
VSGTKKDGNDEEKDGRRVCTNRYRQKTLRVDKSGARCAPSRRSAQWDGAAFGQPAFSLSLLIVFAIKSLLSMI